MIDRTCRIGESVIIGYTPENNVRRIRFDIGKWLKAWPDTVPEMLIIRPGEDAPYVALTAMEGEEIVWTVRDFDTQQPGMGEMWVVFHGAEGELGVMPRTHFMVESGPPGIHGETPPEAASPWVIKVLEAAKRIEEMGGVSDEQVARAVEAYLDENPIEAGVTEEELVQAVEDALTAAKESGVFDGPVGPRGPAGKDGKDYVLTESDKEEIAEMAAEKVEVSEGGSNSGNYTLPIASPTTLGGVKPMAKTDAMTQAVGVDTEGLLFTAPGVGGGASEWKPVVDMTIEEDVAAIRNFSSDVVWGKYNEFYITYNNQIAPNGDSVELVIDGVRTWMIPNGTPHSINKDNVIYGILYYSPKTGIYGYSVPTIKNGLQAQWWLRNYVGGHRAQPISELGVQVTNTSASVIPAGSRYVVYAR